MDYTGNMTYENGPASWRPKIVLTQAQFALLLLRKGLKEKVDSIIDSLPSPEKEEMFIWYSRAASIPRNSERVESIRRALGLTAVEVDAMFAEAAQYS